MRNTPPLSRKLLDEARNAATKVIKRGINGLLMIAPSRKVWNWDKTQWDGFRNKNGRVYMLCPFHREKSPSFVIYPREMKYECVHNRTPDGTWLKPAVLKGRPLGKTAPYYHCYGCGVQGSTSHLCSLLRRDAAELKALRWWRKEQPTTCQGSCTNPAFTGLAGCQRVDDYDRDIPF